MGDTRLEDVAKFSGKTSPPVGLYAPDYARGTNSQLTGQNLAELISAWRFLSDTKKAEVSRLIRVALAEEGRG